MAADLVVAPEVRSLFVDDEQSGLARLRHDGSDPAVMRQRIDALTALLLGASEHAIELRVEHAVEDGMYMRKLFIPKGTLLVGKIHLKSCMNIVASGDIDVLTEFGCRRLFAGFTGVSKAGIQKVGLAHEDTVFINVFRTDKTDIADIETEIAAQCHEPLVAATTEQIAQVKELTWV